MSLPRFADFLKSPHHAWLALLTLGGSVALGGTFPLIIGAAAYALGWVYLPDSRLLRAWRAKRAASKKDHNGLSEADTSIRLLRERKALYQALIPTRRERYDELVAVAKAIEKRLSEQAAKSGLLSVETQLQQLDQLMWTYLLLLKTEQDQRAFLSTEDTARLQRDIQSLEFEVGELTGQTERLEAAGDFTLALTRKRMLDSKRDRLEAVRKRFERVRETESHAELAVSEQERLASLVRLIRADLLSSNDVSHFTHHINSGAMQLGSTQAWLSEIEPLSSSLSIAQSSRRMGYGLDPERPTSETI